MSEERQEEEKAAIIDLLQETIQRLETIVNQLNQKSKSALPSMTVVKTLAVTTEKLITYVEKPPENKVTLIQEEEEVKGKKSSSFYNSSILTIRSFLPSSWSDKLSDWAITGILSGIFVVLIVAGISLLSPSEPVQDQIVELPLPIEVEKPTEVEVLPISPIDEVPTISEPVTLRENPPKLAPLINPQPNLIAAIQNQVAEITSRYSEELIESIEANFMASRLIVYVTDDWYQLTSSQQQKIANEILQSSRILNFRKLEITDAQNTLLARSPVVGENMVIMQNKPKEGIAQN